ncbi:Sec-independent protein translocase subunit TatA [Cellulomonas sp. DKR-3]|uniref:Sec-independent protein translocase protein TatA n=1 Tax=Cellulomonas fulva TaxID=2835530 RepID=A0ABS5U190_9CELL|nr:Sec-independent protein translocase subunit TatA [Cellulomonas fulva]MBT0995152.1 Sec-independent protein translocase subunit TatA [Cellulomonas fulva]
MRVQPWHVVVLLVVILLLFGAKRLPDLAKSVGQSMKIFKNEVKDLRDDPPATAPLPPVADAPAAPPVTPAPAPAPAPQAPATPPADRPAEGGTGTTA